MEDQKKLNTFDVLMLLISGLLFADSIAANTSAGVQNLTWWVIIGLLYMIPTGFIIGELSSVYPDEGGIYVWIRAGLGSKVASCTSWLFFCCGLFIPVATFIMCSDILYAIFLPQASYLVRVVTAIAMMWLMAAVSCLPMKDSKWITNLSGLIKLSFFLLALVAGIVYLAKGNPIANDITPSSLIPSLGQGLTYLPVILYSCTGMELASASAQQTKDPQRSLPRIIVIAAIMAVLLNIIADAGMLMALPLEQIDLDLGLLDLISVAFGSELLTKFASLAFVFAGFVQCVTWLVGANRGTAESAKAGDLPAIFGCENRGGQPVGAILFTAALGTGFLVLYALLGSTASDLFFRLISCGVIASVVPYVLMLFSYQRLKRAGKLSGSHFHTPGGYAFSWLCQFIQVFTLLLMIYIPTHGWNENVLTNLFGLLFMLGTALLLLRYTHRHSKNCTR